MRVRALILVLFLFGAATTAAPQNKGKVKPLPAGASFEETVKWLTDAIARAASYKTDERSVSVSDVGFENCKLSFATAKQYDSRSYATMGTTKRSTFVKGQFLLDLKAVSPDGIYLTSSLVPELAIIVFSSAKYRPSDSPLDAATSIDSGKLAEFELKRTEAENLTSGFIAAARLCQAAR